MLAYDGVPMVRTSEIRKRERATVCGRFNAWPSPGMVSCTDNRCEGQNGTPLPCNRRGKRVLGYLMDDRELEA